MANEKTPLLDGGPINNREISDSIPSDTNQVNSGWSRRQILTAVALCLQNVCFAISFGIISPFYPTEAAKKGASSTVVGMVFGVFQLIIFITSPIYGNFIHKIGAKYMFISGSFILGGCSICFGFLDRCPDGVVYIVMCFVCRSIEANGSAMLSTASFAIMAKTFPNDIGKAMGLLETFSGVGMILGPSIGGGLYTVGGFLLPFVVMGGFIWCITLISFFILPSVDDLGRVEKSILHLLKIPGCVVIYFVIMACAIALSFLDPTFSPFMYNTFKLDPGKIGLIFMTAPGLYALTAPIAGIFTDKGFQASSATIGLFVCGISFLLLGPSSLLPFIPSKSLVETIIGLAVMGMSIGFAILPVFPIVMRLAKSHGFDDGIQTLGIVSGFFNSGFSIGGFLGPTAAGFFDQLYGFAASASICAFIIIFVGIVFAAYVFIMWMYGMWPIPIPDDPPQAISENNSVAKIAPTADV